MPYIRVRSNDTGHEFDADPGRVSAHPEWVVVDDTPVDVQRPPTHNVPKPAEKPKGKAPTFGVIDTVEDSDLD